MALRRQVAAMTPANRQMATTSSAEAATAAVASQLPGAASGSSTDRPAMPASMSQRLAKAARGWLRAVCLKRGKAW